MFKDLDLRSAARRSAVVVAIYLGMFYVLNAIFPESFGLTSQAQVVSLLINAVFFFFIFTFIYALVDRRRRRILTEARKKDKDESTEKDGEDASLLKGRPNPNTSRKKASRRRR